MLFTTFSSQTGIKERKAKFELIAEKFYLLIEALMNFNKLNNTWLYILNTETVMKLHNQSNLTNIKEGIKNKIQELRAVKTW